MFAWGKCFKSMLVIKETSSHRTFEQPTFNGGAST